MTETKSQLTSKTILGIIWAAISLTGFTGLNVDWQTGDFSGNVYDIWDSIVPLGSTIAGLGVAWYGRLVATLRIG